MELETVLIGGLIPHPRNYRQHPDDQIEHLMESIKQNGVYRNVVISKDGYILAGHGVVLALSKLGHDTCNVYRLDIDHDSPQALKVVIGDNEISHLAEVNDRALSELLKQVKDDSAEGLLGTGYDDMMLASLLMVTRPASEIQDFDEAAQWVGLPEYENGPITIKLVVSFRDEADREMFCDQNDMKKGETGKTTWSTWWPAKQREDLSSVRFDTDG